MQLRLYSPMSYALLLQKLKSADVVYVPMEMSSTDVLARMNMIINRDK